MIRVGAIVALLALTGCQLATFILDYVNAPLVQPLNPPTQDANP